jgi:hypothetical protein
MIPKITRPVRLHWGALSMTGKYPSPFAFTVHAFGVVVP